MGWKYVMFETKLADCIVHVPVIFPDKLVHKDIADYMTMALMTTFKVPVKTVSAGKIEHVTADGLGGDSETLKLKSHPEDAVIIEAYSYLHGLNSER